MFNQNRLLSQLKKDAKSLLYNRVINDMLYLTNREYLVRIPVAAMPAFPKLLPFLVETFGIDWRDKQRTKNGVSKYAVDVRRVIPDNTSPGRITRLLWESEKWTCRIVKYQGGIVILDNVYASMLEEPAGDVELISQSPTSPVLRRNDDYLILVMPINLHGAREELMRELSISSG